jgi:hypothetical protein
MTSFCMWKGVIKLLDAHDLALIWDLMTVAEPTKTLGGAWWPEAACDY